MNGIWKEIVNLNIDWAAAGLTFCENDHSIQIMPESFGLIVSVKVAWSKFSASKTENIGLKLKLCFSPVTMRGRIISITTSKHVNTKYIVILIMSDDIYGSIVK
jgi:hypothetical protein